MRKASTSRPGRFILKGGTALAIAESVRYHFSMIVQILEEHGVVRRFSGVVTWAEFEKAFEEFSNSRLVGELRFAVNDFRACESIELDPGELETLAARTSATAINRGKGFRVAYVVGDTDVLRTISNYLDQGSVRTPSKIFKTHEDAREWATRMLIKHASQGRS